MVDDLKLFSQIHLGCAEAVDDGLLCRRYDICRAVAAYPGIHLYAVTYLSAQQLVYRCIVVFAFNIPQRLIDARNGTHQYGSAAIEGPAIHGLPMFFDLQRVFADQVVRQFVHGRSYSVCPALKHWFAPTN